MQRRNFISNLAVILPAGAVAPNLLFESSKKYKNLVKTKVLVLGAGEAGLFIAAKLKKQKLETIILEPSGGVSKAAAYNHTTQAGVIRQYDRQEKAVTKAITENHFDGMVDEVKTGFIPSEIKKTPEGYIVSNGEQTYQAEKLVLALPFEVNTENADMHINANAKRPVTLSVKRKGQKNPAKIRTITAGKIDEEILARFASEKFQTILAVV